MGPFLGEDEQAEVPVDRDQDAILCQSPLQNCGIARILVPGVCIEHVVAGAGEP